jgi:CheY-like chemotaxis protein
MAASGSMSTLVVVDSDPAWDRVVMTSHRVIHVDPAHPEPLEPVDVAVAVVNLAAPGGLEVLHGLARAPIPVWGCLTVAGSEHAIPLRSVAITTSLRPAERVRSLVRRRHRRRARIVAGGRDAPALLALRRLLAADGLGTSLAWDALQTWDLCDLVQPHMVVLDLGLPRTGHDIVARLGLRRHAPDLVLVPHGDDARAFEAAFARARRRERLPRRHEALATMLNHVDQPLRPATIAQA